jgi:hypothetical protein
MFTQTWKKYLPVIVLLMKRADKSEQVLDMNHTDFERAAGGKKVRFSFPEIRLENGRISYQQKITPLANDLVLLLQEDDRGKKIIANQAFEFSMNSSFQLKIKNITIVDHVEAVDPSVIQ